MTGRTTLLCALLLLPGPVAAQQDSIRVFFLGRSEFGASGGMPTPFQEVCQLAGVRCSAHRHWDFIPNDRSNGLPPSYTGIARNRHVLKILTTEKFHSVFLTFFAHNTEFYRPGPEYTAGWIDGFEDLYRLITVAGARLRVVEGYATLDNPGDTTRIAEGTRLLMSRLDSIAHAAGTPPALLVPGGPFFNRMARELGPDRWFADPLHASELAQYAIARFFFACMTGRNPTGFAHPARIAREDARRIDAAIVEVMRNCTGA